MVESESFEQYIERVRAHRAELRESVAAVDEALAGPIGKPAWTERVLVALAELARDFADHIDLTERPGGIYDTVRQTQERLSGAVDQLVGEHASLAADLKACLDALDAQDESTDLRAYREQVTALMGRLIRHRQRGGDLVYEAYSVDLGGQG